MAIHVNLSIDTTTHDIPSSEELSSWFNTTATFIKDEIPDECSINVALIDQSYSQHLNSQFRKKDKPTNVLSFPNHIIPGELSDSLGDLAICPDIVNQEAIDQNKPQSSHWAHMCIHGMLHLIGYDHETESDAKNMEQLEIAILSSVGYDNPYE